MKNVIALAFGETDQARNAIRSLKSLHRSGNIRLEAVAIVERLENGRTIVLEHAEIAERRGTAGGGIVGAVIGLLTGPLGLLIGGASGAVVGSLRDAADVETSEDLLRWLGRAVPCGHVAAIAVAAESNPEAVDALTSGHGVVPLRRPKADVELEIAGSGSRTSAGAPAEDTPGAVGHRLSR